MTLRIASNRVLLDGALVPAVVTVEDARVTHVQRVGEGDAPEVAPAADDPLIDLGAREVCPQPIDLHFHGAGGVSVPPAGDASELDARIAGLLSTDGLWELVRFTLPDSLQAELGAPCEYLATLPVPADPPEPPVGHVASAARAFGAMGTDGACAGIRIEGLFLNPARRGVWPAATFHAPDTGLLDECADACDDAGCPLRIVDVAPELPGAIALIEHAVARGIVVSLAHTDATWDQALRGIDAGATLATHTFNAMRGIHHREPGVAAVCMVDPRVTCEVICDGVHLHPGAIALAARASGPGGIAAISDASPFAGLPPGEHDWMGLRITGDGERLTDADGNLAGAARLLDAAPATLAAAGISRADALVAIAAAPRRVLDPTRPLGLAPGDRLWLPAPAPVHSAHG